MYLTYTKNDGTTFKCFYRDFCDTLEVIKSYRADYINPKIELNAPVHEDWDNTECTFQYEGETFNFHDFEAMTVGELVQKIKTEQDAAKAANIRPWVSENDALCTFLKYTKSIGIVMDMQCFNTYIPGIGLCLKCSGSKIAKVLMVPVEDRYNKAQWSYKVDLKPYSDKYIQYVGCEHPYFSDLWSSIVDRPDMYQLVNLDDYTKNPDAVVFEFTGKTA